MISTGRNALHWNDDVAVMRTSLCRTRWAEFGSDLVMLTHHESEYMWSVITEVHGMEVVLVIASTAACGPRVYALCQRRGSYSVEDASYDQFVAHDSSTSCTLCGTPNCTDAVSPFYACYPYNRTCSVCGSSSAPIGPDYTVTIQKSCSTARPCASNSVVVMPTSYTFAYSNGLTIEGQTEAEEVKAACPVFVFVHAIRFTIRSLVVDCQSSSGNPSAAVVIQESAGLVMTLSSLTFMGRVEVATNSGVFTREWTKATSTIDCNQWKGTVVMKE